MMLRYTLQEPDLAARIERAVSHVLDQGYRTADIHTDGMRKVGTKEMGAAVLTALLKN
jgi:3-isopropylmalate dehydrogenase